jgi:hypothetical protein
MGENTVAKEKVDIVISFQDWGVALAPFYTKRR